MVAATAYHMSAGMPGWLRRVSSMRGVRGVGRFPDIVVVVVLVVVVVEEEEVSRLVMNPSGSFAGDSWWGLFFLDLSGCAVDVLACQLACLAGFRQAPRAWAFKLCPGNYSDGGRVL